MDEERIRVAGAPPPFIVWTRDDPALTNRSGTIEGPGEGSGSPARLLPDPILFIALGDG